MDALLSERLAGIAKRKGYPVPSGGQTWADLLVEPTENVRVETRAPIPAKLRLVDARGYRHCPVCGVVDACDCGMPDLKAKLFTEIVE